MVHKETTELQFIFVGRKKTRKVKAQCDLTLASMMLPVKEQLQAQIHWEYPAGKQFCKIETRSLNRHKTAFEGKVQGGWSQAIFCDVQCQDGR